MNNIHGFSKKKILDIYKSMYLSRQLDEKLFYLSSNQKLFSSISKLFSKTLLTFSLFMKPLSGENPPFNRSSRSQI